MNTANLNAVAALNRRYLLDFPYEAARQLESMSPDDGAVNPSPAVDNPG